MQIQDAPLRLMQNFRSPLALALAVVWPLAVDVSAQEINQFDQCKLSKSPGPLHDAVRRNALEDVECLLKHGYPINFLGRYGYTAISLSRIGLEQKDDRVLRHLLKNGADVNLGKSPILSAVVHQMFRDAEEIDGTLEEKAPSKIASEFPYYFRRIELILSHGGNMNQVHDAIHTSNTFFFASHMCETQIATRIDFKEYFSKISKGSKGVAAFQAGETKLMKQTKALVPLGMFWQACIDAALEAFGENNRI